MKKYIGVKIIEAVPVTRGEYNRYRGWTNPEMKIQQMKDI